eukprot:7391868-Prymnesium_polylepis.3
MCVYRAAVHGEAHCSPCECTCTAHLICVCVVRPVAHVIRLVETRLVFIPRSVQLFVRAGYGAKEPEPEPKLKDLAELLTENKLEHLGTLLGADATLQSLQDESTTNRVEFLNGLKVKGVDALPDRQKLANALGKAKRQDRF